MTILPKRSFAPPKAGRPSASKQEPLRGSKEVLLGATYEAPASGRGDPQFRNSPPAKGGGNYKIKEITIQGKGKKQDESACEIFVYQPENIEETRLGSFFALGKIDSEDEAAHIINLLSSTIKRAYYSSRKKKTAAGLENGLKKANSTLRELAKNKNYNLFNKIHFVCAVLSKDQLRFTSIGKIKAFLLRDGRLTDISKKLVPAQDKVNPRKPFQSIASGKLFVNDKIILATADFFHYIPQKGLKQIIDSGQIDHLETIIKENKEVSPQAILIIDLLPEKTLASKQPEILTFSEAFPLAEKPQPKILNPFPAEKFISEFNLFSRNLAYKIRDLWRFSRANQYISPQKLAEKTQIAAIEPGISAPMVSKDNVATQGALIPPPLKKSKEKRTISHFALGSFNNYLKNIFVFLRKFAKNISIGSREIISNFRQYSPRRQKIIISALIIAVLSAAGGRQLLYSQYQKQISENEGLFLQNQEKIDQMNKIIHLENLDAFGSIPANNFGFTPDQLLTTEKNLIITTRQKTDVFYSFSLADQSKGGNFIPTELPKDKNWQQTAIYKNNLILLAEGNDFYKYNFTDKTSSLLDINLQSPALIPSIATFNNNLYLFDAINNQIIKCPQLENCQNWLQQESDFSSASSLTIDGSVFVLYPDGVIVEYFNGARKKSIKPEIKPPSNSFEKNITDYGFKNFYLLDKEQKRIVIIDKQGALIKQYFSPSFENIKDIQVSPDEKIIYVLSGDKVYKIEN